VGVAAGRLLPFTASRPAAIFLLTLLAMAAGVTLAMATGSVPTTASSLFLDVLLGLALLRGVVHGRSDALDRPTEALARSLPVLVGGGWLLGLVMAGDGRAGFVSAAFVATLLCIVATALALGSERLPDAADTRFGESTGRVWLMLLLLVTGSLVVVALPVSAIIGLPVARSVTFAVTSAIVIVVSLILGILGALAAVIAAIIGSLLGSILPTPSALPIASPPPSGPRPTPGPVADTAPSFDVVGPVLGVLLLMLLVGAAWYLAVRWQGSRDETTMPDQVMERRSIALDLHLGLPALGRLASRLRGVGAPSGAIEAYPRLLLDWAAPDPQSRWSSESPAAHAARLRADGRGDLGLDLLVADYELARFGGRDLSAAEDRRAVARWRRLRANSDPLSTGVTTRR